MKTMQPKKGNEDLIKSFLAKGGKITHLPLKVTKPRSTNPGPRVVEVEVDVLALPPELRKFVKIG